MATICLARSNGSVASMNGLLSGGSRRPPRTPRTASGFSGRRFCRIFPCADQWQLQVEKGGWPRSAEDESHKTFPTLTAAITYAVQRGLNYRVVHVPPIAAPDAREETPMPPKKFWWRGVDDRGVSTNS
jgi:hypothetical protein